MKTAFITGASRGLGRGFVELLLNEGYKVVAGVRKPGDHLLVHENLIIVQLDLGDEKSIDAAVATVRDVVDSLDLVVNCGALQRNSPELGNSERVCKLGSLSGAALLKMFEVNTVAPMLVLQGLLPLLNVDPCYCINISSARGSLYTDETANSSGNYGYRASKSALSMMTMASTFDLPKNVRTFSVHPGLVKTDMNPTGNISPLESATLILDITKKWDAKMQGAFLKNDGSVWSL